MFSVKMGAMTDLDIDPRTDPGHTPWYLEGNFGPVFDEVTDVNLRVTGSIPPSLSGRDLRTGSIPPWGVSSLWDGGDGWVHGVRLDAGNAAWYRMRYVQTS